MSHSFELIPGEDRTIRGDFHPAAGGEPKATIVICHGFKGFKDWGMFPPAAERLAAASFDVVRFNYANNGVGASLTEFDELEKFAKQTFSGNLDDLDTLVTHIRNGTLPVPGRQPTGGKVLLLGHSRGGGEALVYAFDHPEAVAGVVCWNGAVRLGLSFGAVRQRMQEEGRAYIENARTGQPMPLDRVILDDLDANRERFAVIDRARTAKLPVVLVQGTRDIASLIEGSAMLVDANSAVKWVRIAEGDHTFCAKHPFQGEPQPLADALAVTVDAFCEMTDRGGL